jgi:hypothetical protein
MGNQYVYEQGSNLNLTDWDYISNVQQEILKNGLKLTWAPGNAMFLDGGVVYTNLLDEAAVPNYWAPFLGVGVRFGADSGLRVGYRADLGDGYTSQGGDVVLYFSY